MIRNGVASISSFSLTPIPFFVLMGEVLFHTGVAMKAIDAIDRLIARVPGRLSVVAVVAGTVFSAISGSTIATTALLGSLLAARDARRGYQAGMAMGPIMAIGGVDMLIPPSALTVLLGSLAGISISQLLLAGIVPGVSSPPPSWPTSLCAPSSTRTSRRRSRTSRRGLGALASARRVRPPARDHLRGRGARHGGGLGDPHRVRRARRGGHRAGGRALSGADVGGPDECAAGDGGISGVILFIIVGATTFSQILTFSGATNGLVAAMQEAEFGPPVVLAV